MTITKRILPIVQVIAFLLAMVGIADVRAQAQGGENVTNNPNPELVGQLTKELNVTPEQATGGAGAIFGLVKSKLSPADFNKVAAAVPGMDGFLKAAPASQGGTGPGSLGSMVPGKLGGVASLAGSFQSLGLSPSMVGKFAPVLQKYIGAKGGPGTASLFAGALK